MYLSEFMIFEKELNWVILVAFIEQHNKLSFM